MKSGKFTFPILATLIFFGSLSGTPATAFAYQTNQESLRALIVDGQNNHRNWPQTTIMMRHYLEETGRFQVDVATSAPQGTDENFRPDFSQYDVVVSNYNGAAWPESTQRDFESYVKSGGGFVVVHAANNAFPKWKAYNEIIGLGGWGGRNETSGPYVYYDSEGKPVVDQQRGPGGHHGRQHPFQVIVRDRSHPITAGMPSAWMHVNDELYDKLRGPAENMTVLATAFADPKTGGSGRHEPMVFTVAYGQGRVFHTPMGHGNDSHECVGFKSTLQRGAEWAATGNVTIPIPDNFPSANEVSQVAFDFESVQQDETPFVVFVTGDEEYRSEESMPMLARILKRDFGFRVHVCYSLDANGFVDPNNTKSISGMENLKDADLMVLFTRFRDLPEEQFQYFLDYVDAGKPLVGFRTATHAFKFSRPERKDWNNEKIAALVGQRWITHHGHRGNKHLTRAEVVESQKNHPVLRGVDSFPCYSWLYHVDGGEQRLQGDSVPLMTGTSLDSGHAESGNLDRFPITQPTAWVKSHQGIDGKVGRVFFSTTAHPYDFKEPAMRKLALNGILWALGLEDRIPENGCNPDTVGEYEPNNAGFGNKFKQEMKPVKLD